MKRYLSVLIILLVCSCNNVKPSVKENNLFEKKETELQITKLKTDIQKSPIHQNISTKFNFQTSIKRIPTDYFDSCLVNVVVRHKENGNSVFNHY